MRISKVLPLAALGSAFVLPPEQVLSEIAIEDHRGSDSWYDDAVSMKDDALNRFKKHYDEVKETSNDAWEDVAETSKDAWEEVLDTSEDVREKVTDASKDAWRHAEKTYKHTWDEVAETSKEAWKDAEKTSKNAWKDAAKASENAWDQAAETSKGTWKKVSKNAQSALDEAFDKASDAADTFGEDMQSWAGEAFEALDHDHHGPPHHGRPHQPPHHHKPNLTVYQMIAESKYTTKLAKLISEYDDLVEALNSTKANYTIFAPTDKAFEKIPEHAPKPSKEWLKAILSYHVVDGFYPAGRVLVTHTAPTLLKSEHLSSKPEPQRITFKVTLRGLTVNWYSRIVAVNIFGTNGVIHGVDSLILPPPKVLTLIDLFPGEFSTLELGLGKTGLIDVLNATHPGGTLFAPSNFAFQKLGPRINAFLFSKYGNKYLKALLEYHVVPSATLYSDAIYTARSSDVKQQDFPKGHFHVDLPTLLEDRSLSVDIARFGGFISMKINAFTTVSAQDGVAENGVLQVVRNVLIPPKKLGGTEDEHWDGSELTVEDLVERLDPLVAKSDL